MGLTTLTPILLIVLRLPFIVHAAPLQILRSNAASNTSFNSSKNSHSAFKTSTGFEDYNIYKETQEKPVAKSTIDANCSQYSDCYNCSVNKQCQWCSVEECGGVCYHSDEELKWYQRLRRCDPNENSAMREICPSQSNEVEESYRQIIAIPPDGHTMPKNGFCFWQIYNNNEQEVDIEITKYEVSLLLVCRRRTDFSLLRIMKGITLMRTTVL